MHAGFLQHVFTLKVDKASGRLETDTPDLTIHTLAYLADRRNRFPGCLGL